MSQHTWSCVNGVFIAFRILDFLITVSNFLASWDSRDADEASSASSMCQLPVLVLSQSFVSSNLLPLEFADFIYALNFTI